jgi:hypothetical protein
VLLRLQRLGRTATACGYARRTDGARTAKRGTEARRWGDVKVIGTPNYGAPCVRGHAGGWGFALDESSGGFGWYEEDAAIGLSQGTEAILFTHTATIDTFHYYVDSVEVTAEATASRAALPSRVGTGNTGRGPESYFRAPRMSSTGSAATVHHRNLRYLKTNSATSTNAAFSPSVISMWYLPVPRAGSFLSIWSSSVATRTPSLVSVHLSP